MALVLADIGADAILEAYFNKAFPAGGDDLTLKLFVIEVTPADSDTIASYTEAVGGGYAAKTLTNGSWTITSTNDPSDAVYAEQVFTFTGPLTTNGTIYGYWVEDADGVLIFAEKFSSSFTPVTNGDHLDFTPVIQLSKGTPT